MKKDDIESKVNYALLAYNNSIHSVTKLTPLEIINGHINNNSPFEVDLESQIVNNYMEEHREKVKLLYSKINEISSRAKKKVINKPNENREDIPDIPEKVFVRIKQNQGKTKNKYKQERIKSLNKDLINRNHRQVTREYTNIHLSNAKRPRRQKKTIRKLLQVHLTRTELRDKRCFKERGYLADKPRSGKTTRVATYNLLLLRIKSLI
jgi:hypothetical protein